MSAWRTKRQILYIIIILLIIFVPIGLFIFFSSPGPTCFDGKQNQDEFGIDCGGSCQAVCEDEVADHIIQWQRIFEERPGKYYLAAFVENPNTNFIATRFDYTFSVYNKNNDLILEKSGSNYSNPRERFVIFESDITFSGDIPETVFLEIEGVSWTRDELYTPPDIMVRDERLTLSDTPRLTATVTNEESGDSGELEVSALVFNEESNVIAVSRTRIDSLSNDEQEGIFFVWPEEFKEEPRICARPVESVLVFDRSGSMNDDGLTPAQPLTDAQNAARLFINQLSMRDKIGLVSFATTASDPIDQELTEDKERAKDAVSNISILPEDETGSTNLGEGLRHGSNELQRVTSTDTPREVLVVLTDGRANAPKDPGGEPFAQTQAQNAKGLGQEIYTIGLGNEVNQSFLRSLATTPEHYFFSATSKELADVYTQIARDVCPERIYLTGIFIRPINADF